MSPHVHGAKHLTIYCHPKGHKPKVISTKLESTIAPSTPPCPTVNDWYRKLILEFDILGTVWRPGRSVDCDLDLDDRVFSALNEFPFHSLRTSS
jgi:hypothetical protein